MWLYPDGTRLLELSTKCPPSKAFDVMAQMIAYLDERGVVRDKDPQTKTEDCAAVLRELRWPTPSNDTDRPPLGMAHIRSNASRAADAQLDALTPGLVQESDELYLLSVHGDASIKIRDGLMDVKHREQVDTDGLELWLPVLKAAFPLAAADVAVGADGPRGAGRRPRSHRRTHSTNSRPI